LGTHLLLELYGCNAHTLRDKETVEKILIKAAREARAKIVDVFFHQFKPHGVSGVVIIEESHFTIHTWPEHKFAAVDLFFCSKDVDIERAVEVLSEEFGVKQMSLVEMKRGILPRNYPLKEKEALEAGVST